MNTFEDWPGFVAFAAGVATGTGACERQKVVNIVRYEADLFRARALDDPIVWLGPHLDRPPVRRGNQLMRSFAWLPEVAT